MARKVVNFGNPERGEMYREIEAVIVRHKGLQLEDIVAVLELLKLDYYRYCMSESLHS